jgi:hypothetical protein
MKARVIKQIILISLLTVITFLDGHANKGVVKGKIVDSKNQPIEFATAALINSKTSKVEKGTVCNQEGSFIIENVAYGEYILSVRMLGYDLNESETVIIDNNNQIVDKTIVLEEAIHQLNEAVVTGKYAFVEQTVDKTIVNPNASIISSSESVYDILKKSPGVNIDNNDNITLKGMQGVIIMIDDKPTHVSGKDLTPILKGILGKNIKSIEIIENPSARYDAEGNSGIINIKTKHNKAPGFNGSVNAGLTFTRTVGGNAGADLNMNFGKLNVYSNYAFYDWKGWYKMEGTRGFSNDTTVGSYTFMSNESNSDGDAHNYKLGADYYIATNHVVSIMLSGNNGSNNMLDDGLSAFQNSTSSFDSSVTSFADRIMEWDNKTFNANYKWDIDSMGHSLIADADYARFIFNSEAMQSSKFYDAFNTDLNKDASLTSAMMNEIEILSAKLDYAYPISKTYSVEAGLKSSFVNIDSRAKMLGYINQNDKFLYKENIQAGYISGLAQFKSTSVQLGLRVENTTSQGNSISTSQVDDNSYINIFPSFFVQQVLSQKQSLGFRYSYRIGRPNYHVLNPFKWMMDPYTYNLGNPKLSPQFTHALSVNHNYNGKFLTSIGYNYSTDLFTEVIYQNEETKSAYQTNENFGASTDINVSETVQLQPTNYWRLSGTAVGMYKEVNAKESFGDELKQWSFIGNLSSSFNLPYGISFEVSGKYISKQLFGNLTLKPHYSIDLGVQMLVLNNKGTIRASFSDIFNTGSSGVYSKYGNLELDMMTQYETRRLNISFNYRFGKSEFKTRANRSTASSEEQGRSSK